MKRLCVVVSLALASLIPCHALAGEGQTELTIAGSGTDFKEGQTSWDVVTEILFGGEHFVLGPSVVLSNVDELNRFGIAIEWNLMGQKKGGLFIGGTAHYFQKDIEGFDRHSVAARVGGKFRINQSFIKPYVEQAVDGRIDQATDRQYAVGAVILF